MCYGFGMIVTIELKGYFTLPDEYGDISHSDILNAAGIRDTYNPYTRRFVRVECSDWTMRTFRFDEDSTLPGWVEENRQVIMDMAEKRMERAAPAVSKFRSIYEAAQKERMDTIRSASKKRDEVIAELNAVYQYEVSNLINEEAPHSDPWMTFSMSRSAAIHEHEQICIDAHRRFGEVRAEARNDLVNVLSSIEGYVEP